MRKESRAFRIQHGVDELSSLIRSRFPDVEFEVTRRHWPVRGVYIDAFLDVDDDFEVTELISERRADLLTELGIYFLVFVKPLSERPSLRPATDKKSAKSA